MKKSIGFRMFIGINGIIIIFLLLLWIINSQFLEQYYVAQKKDTLIDAAKMIDAVYEGDIKVISDKLNELEHTSGMRISIFASNNIKKYDSVWHSFDMPAQGGRMGNGMGRLEERMDIIQPNGFVIRDEPQFKTGFLYLTYNLNNNDFIQLGIPISSIKESVNISNHFLGYIGIFAILIGSLVAFLFTKSFTKPVLKLNEIALNMSKLDFSQKYISNDNDEIAMLGNSINSLSEQLDLSITELKKANEVLQSDIEQKIKLDNMRKEFIYGVSHELKTPITLIQGYAEGLKLNINQDEAGRDFYCDIIMDESKKMNKMVMELLELAQIESGYMKLEKQEFDLSNLLYRVIEKYSLVFEEKEIKLDMRIMNNIVVNGDADRLEQVIVNYINNAINHINDEKIIKINVKTCNKIVRVSVFNTGNNIPNDELEYVWDSFYKVDKSRSREYGGVGLGLSIVRIIMNLHETGYGVENCDNGVEFWFEAEIV